MLHGPDGTPNGTPVLVNDGPSEFVTGKLGPVGAGRHRFTLTSGGQEYSTEQVCEGGTEDKPQRIDIITPSQERDSIQPLVLPPYTWIVVHGPNGMGNGITVDINSGFLETVTGRPYKIRVGQYTFTIKWGSQEHSTEQQCPERRSESPYLPYTENDPYLIKISA